MADNYEQLAQAPLGDNILAQIAATARSVLDAQNAVKAREEELKAAQAHLRALEEEILPELMSVAGQEKLTTIDGLIVEVKQLVRGQPSAENASEAYAWMRANGQGGVIKTKLETDLGKGSPDKVQAAIDALKEIGLRPVAKEGVHYQTLGAMVREMLAKGTAVPLDLLGVHLSKKAEVKPKG